MDSMIMQHHPIRLMKYHLRVADKLAVKEYERRARLVLSRNKKLGEFINAMGSYFFTDRDGEIIHGYDHPLLRNFVIKYNSIFKLTGEPMRFTAKGKKITDW
jgi:hypothetical protein